MGSITGLKRGKFTSIDNSGEIRLGSEINPGTVGQALVSGGPGEPARWDTHTGTIQPLTMGTDLSLASGNATFDGSIPDTINAAGHGFGSGGNGIDISGTVITTDNDGVTINNTGGTGAQNQVLKVPNTLTITDSAGGSVVFDGSSTQSITINDNNTQLNLTGGDGINVINTGGLNRTITTVNDGITIRNTGGFNEVLRVPNTLTITDSAGSSAVFDGSSTQSITINDNDTTYQGGTGISIDTTTNPDTINCASIPNSALQNSTISGIALGNNLSTITFYNSSGGLITSYNGANPPTSVTLDGDTTYQGGKNISINTATNPDTINLDDDLTGLDSITMTSTGGTTAITGNNYPSNPTTCTYLDLSSSTNVFPNFVGGSEILKSMSYIDNSAQNFNRIYNTANKFFFDGSQTSGSDTLEIDFTATSSTGYCEYGFYANSLTGGMVFCCGIAAATGGTSPFSTSLGSGAVSIDAYKLGLFDGTTSTYSLKEILDFTSYENTYITSKFFFNNLSVGTQYKMALYGRCYNSGSIYINSGGKNTTGLASRSFHQPAFMKFYEYDSSIGGARTTGGGM
jgi:hypothetical protein